jgi:hypothetical protein
MFVTPFAGIGVQAATGNINNIVRISETLSLDPDLPGPTKQQTIGIQNGAQGKPRTVDFRVLGGLQFNLGPFGIRRLAGELGQTVYGFSMV